MKKISLLSLLLLATAQFAWGATVTQSFDTGAISPGTDTETAFTVNKFDTNLGTLTRVTFEISVNTWGGSYEVINTTSPSKLVTGDITQGSKVWVNGYFNNNFTPLIAEAVQSKDISLSAFGNSDILNGHDASTPLSSIVAAADVLGGLSGYIGSDTYGVVFHSGQNSSFNTDGAVTAILNSASTQGFLTVTYEYTPVPEPGSLALLAIGCVVLGLRRRKV